MIGLDFSNFLILGSSKGGLICINSKLYFQYFLNISVQTFINISLNKIVFK